MRWGWSFGRLAAVAVVCVLPFAGPGPVRAGTERTFERSVVQGKLTDQDRDYYAAVWAALGFFRGAEEARAILSSFDVNRDRRAIDSVIDVLFLPLDAQPVAPGNTYLDSLPSRIDFCRRRGLLHRGSILGSFFDQLGLLVLLKGIPLTFVRIEEDWDDPTRPVHGLWVGWGGDEMVFQGDGTFSYRLIGTSVEIDRSRCMVGFGCGRNALRASVPQVFNRELTGGVPVVDPDKRMDAHAAVVRPFLVLDTADWSAPVLVVNLGLRARDFTVDVGERTLIRAEGEFALRPSGCEEQLIRDSISVYSRYGSERPESDDLIVLQCLHGWPPTGQDRPPVHEYVLGADLRNDGREHWKRSIPFRVGRPARNVRLNYGWLLNPRVWDSIYLGNRPPLMQDVVRTGDSLFLFFQLTDVMPDNDNQFLTHVRLRFVRKKDRETQVRISQLYLLGKEPSQGGGALDLAAEAITLQIIPTPSANANVSCGTVVPKVPDGLYLLVAECFQTAGGDPRPWQVVLFDDVRIRTDRECAAR